MYLQIRKIAGTDWVRSRLDEAEENNEVSGPSCRQLKP